MAETSKPQNAKPANAKPANDWEIAQAAKLRPIVDLAKDRLGIPLDQVEP